MLRLGSTGTLVGAEEWRMNRAFSDKVDGDVSARALRMHSCEMGDAEAARRGAVSEARKGVRRQAFDAASGLFALAR